jgi:hypothetical protein
MRTIYRITDETGQTTYTEDTTEAEGYSRRGFVVTASTGGNL